ncbi:hypothetical protein ACLQ26_26275 [Micromonospora sp. DT43]|uniref:hypothetical protein n=1 Tax=Micromonospora sp. DT43 TaxID=3393440 RepID=UPI003CF1DA08
MTSPNTELDPVVANSVARQHHDTASLVSAERQKFSAAVDVLDDSCNGAMMRALLSARDAWMDEVSRIVADLGEMAGNVDGTVGDFDEQDYVNAGGVSAVGQDILKDI